MYGYIRPDRPELKIREYERWRGTYCGLCHALSKRYGLIARLAVSYDMTLPALMRTGSGAVACGRRCIVHPFKRRRCVCADEELSRTADMTVILAYLKLRDTVADGGFFKRIGARLLSFVIRRKYRRASAAEPEFASAAVGSLERLSKLEAAPESLPPSALLDESADCFACVTAALSLLAPEGAERRLWREMYYHIGRFVYILDAADDFPRDMRRRAFNAVKLRYTLTAPELPQPVKDELTDTLELSCAAAAAAFELLPESETTSITANILYRGMPETVKSVLDQSDKKKRKAKK